MTPVPSTGRPVLIRSHVGLRGAAALLVVAYHLQFGTAYRLPMETTTALPTRGYLAVDLFFILSGFILSYVNDLGARAPMAGWEVRRFAQARFARLYPLLAFSLMTMMAIGVAKAAVYGALGKPNPTDLGARSLAILASQFLLVNAWIPGAPGWNIPTWSISAEAATYIVFPLLIAWLTRAPRGFVASAAAGSAAFYLAVAFTTGNLDIIGGVAPLRCLAGFLLGMLVFLGRARIARLGDHWLGLMQAIGGSLVIALLAMPACDPLIVPAFVVVVAATWPDRGGLAWMLSTRPLVWLGERSFSIYLMHLATLDMLNELWPRAARIAHLGPATERLLWLGIAFAGVIACAALTYAHVEGPARRALMRRFTSRRPPPITFSPPAP